MIGTIFSQDLDFLTKFIIVLCWASMICLFIYLAMPMSMRRRLERLDFDDKKGGSISWTGMLSLTIAGALGVFKMQKMSISKTAESKLNENHVERDFRLRQQFMTDIHTYLFVMLLGIWLTVNFVLKVNRRREEC